MKMRRLLRLPAVKEAGPTLRHLGLAIVPAVFAAGTPAFAQYAPANQSYSAQNPPAPAYSPVYSQPGPPQAANQSDEQLLTVARLLEQQGRYAQAQRIYTELERRRRSQLQQFPANAQPINAQVVNAPNGTMQAAPWQGTPAPGMTQPGMPQPGMQQQGMPMYESMAMPMSPQMSAPVFTPAPVSMSAPISVPASAPMQPAAPIQPAPPVNAAPVYQAPVAPPVLPNAVASQRGSSESFVVDREFTPQPKRVTPEEVQGWRNALTPLPAALRSDGTQATASSRRQSGEGNAQAASRPYAASTVDLARRDANASSRSSHRSGTRDRFDGHTGRRTAKCTGPAGDAIYAAGPVRPTLADAPSQRNGGPAHARLASPAGKKPAGVRSAAGRGRPAQPGNQLHPHHPRPASASAINA